MRYRGDIAKRTALREKHIPKDAYTKRLTDSLVKGKGGLPKGMEGLAAAAQAAAGGGADEAAAGAKGDEEDMPDMDDNATF